MKAKISAKLTQTTLKSQRDDEEKKERNKKKILVIIINLFISFLQSKVNWMEIVVGHKLIKVIRS